jgi:hypothetical protein
LRAQPCGEKGRLRRARRLAPRRQVRAAHATGALSAETADVVCRTLDDLPTSCPLGQVEGVLTHALPELLGRWVAGNPLDPDPELSRVRGEHVAEVLQAALESTGAPCDRLEAPLVLLAQVLPPAVLAVELQAIVDALEPEALVEEELEAWDDRSVRLVKRRFEPGWRLEAHLTDEAGQRLNAELEARKARHAAEQARLRKAAQQAVGAGELPTQVRQPDDCASACGDALDDDLPHGEFGSAGPGTDVPAASPFSPVGDLGPADTADDPRCGAPRLTPEQLAHDLFLGLLDDVAQVRSPGERQPATVTVTATLAEVEGRVGALPGAFDVGRASVPVSTAELRRLGCGGVLSAVLLDAARHPVGASGSHRHATARERRALRATWGRYCSTDGCGSTRTVPHHVRPFWLSGETKLDDLVPQCEVCHHDLHLGHRVLRLRDGRLLDELGWVQVTSA